MHEMKNVGWKVVALWGIAFLLIFGLVYLQVIGINIGIVSSIAILVLSQILNHLIKPKVSLTIKKVRLEKREYNGIKGYKIKTQIINNGNKIVINLRASVQFVELVKFIRVNIETTDGQKTYKSSWQPLKVDEYSWIDEGGKKIKNPYLDQLRKDDSIELVFPKEIEPILHFAVLPGPSHGLSYDTLLKLDKGEDYQILITLKGEDYEKNTVIKTEKFKIKVIA